jgi:predicted RNA binding protein YcfA (HicA-like mRNA interferase family)
MMYSEGGSVVKLSSKEVIKILQKDGWYLVRIRGSHHQFKHPKKPGLVTVPHPKKDFPVRTIKSILKQAGLEI